GATGAVVEIADVSCWAAWGSAFRPRDLALRISVAPSVVGQTMEVLDRRLAGAGAVLSSTVTAGVIRANAGLGSNSMRPATVIETTQEVASRFGGSLVIDAAPVSIKADIDV